MEHKEIDHTLVSADSRLAPNTDRITICIYSRENKNLDEFNEQMRNERARVERVKQGFIHASENAGQKPPEFVISVQLIPDWSRPGNSYLDPAYLEKKQMFMEAVHVNFSEEEFTIHDFYNGSPTLSEEEKAYLDHLDSGGCTLDMLKVKAIISNRDRKHLQLDSNTLIHNYPEFYNTTFDRENAANSEIIDSSNSVVLEPLDALNAVFYGNDHVSPHSKVVYTTPSGVIGGCLAKRYTEYCNSNPALERKDKKSNQFYSSVFSKAIRDSGLSVSLKKPPGGRRAPGYSPADLNKQEYRITRYVVPAINQEWKEALPRSADSRSSIYDRFIQIDDVMCDMAVFWYIVKKHTVDLIPDGTREQLLALSDVEFDFTIAIQFYNFIQAHHSEELPELMKLIPLTPSGENFRKILLGLSPVPSNVVAASAAREDDVEIHIDNSKK